MMPLPKLNASPVTSSQPPQSTNAARMRSVRGRATRHDQPGHEQDQRGREQPGDLAADLGVEQAGEPGRSPAARPVAAAAADAAGLVAGQPAEAVVAEDQVQEAVVLRAADVGTRLAAAMSSTMATHQPAATTNVTHASTSCHDPSPERAGAAIRYTSANAGHHQERLQHLGEEAEADQRAGEQQPARAAALERADHRVGAADQQQHEQRVGVVEAEHQRRDRREREDRPRRAARRPAENQRRTAA